LGDGKNVEVLMDIEQFHFMISCRILNTVDQDIHDGIVDIKSSKVSQINLCCYLHCIIGKSNHV